MKKGFSLIELLIVIGVIGAMAAMTILMLTGPQKSARDGKRKSDLETIRSGLELLRADCGSYPASLPAVGQPLRGTGTTGACVAANIYIQSIPDDPVSGQDYRYARVNNIYEICAALERGTGTVSCGGSSACGSATCNYKVQTP